MSEKLKVVKYIQPDREHFNPTILDLIEVNHLNEDELTDFDIERLELTLWNDKFNRKYDIWHENVVYETLGKSYDADKLLDDIHKKYEDKLAYLGETNPNHDHKAKSLSIYAKDDSLVDDEDFKSLLNFYNYYVSFCEERRGYYEIYLEPYKPEEKTNYIYDECNGLVYRIVNDNGLKRLKRHGLVARHEKDRYYPRYIFVVADKDKDKLKDTILKIQAEIKKTGLHLIKIDLKKYRNKIRLFVDPASMNYDAYVTREYIPRYCCEEILLDEI